jgi:hypothetical protein
MSTLGKCEKCGMIFYQSYFSVGGMLPSEFRMFEDGKTTEEHWKAFEDRRKAEKPPDAPYWDWCSVCSYSDIHGGNSGWTRLEALDDEAREYDEKLKAGVIPEPPTEVKIIL